MCVLGSLRVLVVAADADGLDEPQAQLARHDRRRHQPAAGDADDGLERPLVGQPPGERARIAMQLVPRDRERLAIARLGHVLSLPLPWTRVNRRGGSWASPSPISASPAKGPELSLLHPRLRYCGRPRTGTRPAARP